MTVQAINTRREREQRDPGCSPGRIVNVEKLRDDDGSFAGTRVHFEDGRWLEVIGASRGWPEEV